MESAPYLLTQWHDGLQGSVSVLLKGFSDLGDCCAQQSKIWKLYIKIYISVFTCHMNEIH